MRRTLAVTALAALVGFVAAPAARADDDDGDNGIHEILKFKTMYGVDGPFVNNNSIRGVLGDEAPWKVGRVSGSLRTNGALEIHVKGLVFSSGPKIGTNDEATFRALVSCLTEGTSAIQTVNITTGQFPATTSGDSNIKTTVSLPAQCVAPIVFVLSGSEDKWFAVTGFEGK